MGNQQTKQTKGDMERRMRNALVLVPKDKDYMGVYFGDKGVKLEVTMDYAVISTSFHRHVFGAFTAQGVSMPYIYTKRFIQIALANDCIVKDEKGDFTRSYVKLMDELKKKEDQTEFRTAWYYDLWLNNIFHPLYAIDDTEAASFLVYESYLHNVARNKIIFSEKVNDITNKEFIEQVGKEMNEFTKDIAPHVVFPKKTDEERMQEEMDAMKQASVDETLKN